MRRVLFIAYLFPPIANSGTRRSLSFVNHLPNWGWEPTVLTVADPSTRSCDAALLDEIRPGTRVERVPLGSTLAANWISRCLAPTARREQMAAALEWRLRRAIQVPDEIASWYITALRRGVELHRELAFDVVYASGWPWTSFLVARAVGLRTGLPYVLDYRDPWLPSGTVDWEKQSQVQAWLCPHLERIAGKRATAVVTVTQAFVPAVRRDSGAPRVHCITNGFEPSDFVNPSDRSPRLGDGVLRVGYTGVWRPGYGPDGLYRALRKLKDEGSPFLARLKVSVAGFAPGPAREFGIHDIVEELGIVPHAQAIDIMMTADMLYLPVSEGFYANASLPGKLFEYLGSGTPVLAAVPTPSETARVLEEVGGAHLVEPGDDAGIARIIEHLCAGGRSDLFSKRNDEALQRYTRASTSRMLAQVLDAARSGVPLDIAP